MKNFSLTNANIIYITQSEISKFEEEFEKGGDPFKEMTDGSQINSVAGVLKLYFRKLYEPIISTEYFDDFMEITSKLHAAVVHFVQFDFDSRHIFL